MRPNSLLAVSISAGFFWFALLLSAEAQDFYQGKRIEITVHASPGGGFDLNARMLARHMGKYIPGNPTMIVKNIPGGGGLIQANYLYRRAKPDGLAMGFILGGLIQADAIELPGVEYDSRRFEWLGLTADSVYVIVSRRDSPVRNLKQLLAPTTQPLILGTTGPASGLYVVPAGLNLSLGKLVGRPVFKLIAGYSGTGPMRTAMERGEIDGFTWPWDSIKATAPHYLEPEPGKGFINLIAYVGVATHPEMVAIGVPNILEHIKTPTDRAFMDFLASPPRLQYPLTAPPGTPKERVRILREAFVKTVHDPEYQSDLARLNLPLNPLPGDEVARIVNSILETPKDVLEMARGLFVK